MKFIAVFSVLLIASSLQAAEEKEVIKDKSQNGEFAMLLTEKEDAGVKIQLIEVSSRKVVLDLADSGHPYSNDCKILWAPDSAHFAFYQARHRGGDTTTYFRKESGFTESPLPELSGCATAAEKKELKAEGVLKFIEGNTTPKEWLKSGALVVVNDQGWETNEGNLRGCTQTVTIGFDAKHKASVLRVTGRKPKEY